VPYRELAPKPALAAYVSCFWERTSAGQPHRVLPDGAIDIVFSLGNAGARVIGPMTTAIVTAGSPAGVVGVRFRPGAAIDLLGVAGRELRDLAIGAADVWGAAGRTLDARLAEAHERGSAIVAIEAELEARVARTPRPDKRVMRAVAICRAAGGELPIPAVAGRVGVSERQLERLFDQRVGLHPKVFARIVRLERATRGIARLRSRGSVASWARLAVDCGYADQAHLIREFRALAGTTPGVFARERHMSEIDNPSAHAEDTVDP
jgi:AraC-like DNA-binding protein